MQSIDAALEAVKQQIEASRGEAVRQARRNLTAELNQFTRRLRQYTSEQEFTRALIEGAGLFAEAVAFFSVEAQSLQLRAQARLELPEDLRLPVESAQAFSQAIVSKELLVALRTPTEVGQMLAGNDRAERVVIVPLQNADRVAGVLFAAGEVDIQGLELIAGLASLLLSRKQSQSALAELKPTPKKADLPPWSALREEQRNLHWRAQRFARVQVSEWQLRKPEACQAGFEQNDLYLFLKKEIEAARETFRAQFMGDRSMVDYLHLELVGVAAEGDESKLGPEYPGPLD